MIDFVPHVISAALQIIAFLLIPFIWWLVTARTQQPFLGWLGWVKPRTPHPGRVALVIAATWAGFTLLSLILAPAVAEVSPSRLSGLGMGGIGACVVYSLAQTAFAEESLFRGFIGKRAAARLGFGVGNLVQATAFGLVHAVPFALLGMNPLVGVGTGVFAAALGWIMFWMNERMADGSLVPSWVLHSLANLFATVFVLFSNG